jgi:anti-anti-sigma factor
LWHGRFNPAVPQSNRCGQVVSGSPSNAQQWRKFHGRNAHIFDMAGIAHIDSAAIGAIVKSLTKLKRAGGGLRIASAQPMIVYSLKMTKLDTLIEMFPTADEAVTGFEAGRPS